VVFGLGGSKGTATADVTDGRRCLPGVNSRAVELPAALHIVTNDLEMEWVPKKK
jgi:hypothetical protein